MVFIDNLLPELKNQAILNKTQEQNIVRYMKITRKQVITLKNSAYIKGYKKISQVVHGDFHPLNVIFAKDRSVQSLIDLDNLSINNPLDDVVRCLLHISYFQFKEHSTNFKEALIIFMNIKHNYSFNIIYRTCRTPVTWITFMKY